MSRILFVDDDPLLRETMKLALVARGHRVTTCGDADSALAALFHNEPVHAQFDQEDDAGGDHDGGDDGPIIDFDVVVTDLNMREVNGIELCSRIASARDDIPVIVLTAFGSYESAVAAMRVGAYDFLSKPVQLDALAMAIERATNHRRLRGELQRLQREVSDQRDRRYQRRLGIVATSAAMQKVLELVDRIAASETTILVTGDSGTGKELIARAIHEASGPRANGPFVAINCAAFPETLLESELFGHVRGAFTDARTSKPGVFLSATGGTIFLDEVGDMPLSMQPKLLRVLQERKVRPVGGGSNESAIDVRVIAATNRDLEAGVEEGYFREDLYYRLNVVNVALPPLRERPADILPLAMEFVAEAAARSSKRVVGISPPAARYLMGYSWPGNVRELSNCIERAVALARFDLVAPDDLPDKVKDVRPSSPSSMSPGNLLVAACASSDPSALLSLEQLERRYIAHVMEAVGRNKSAAARILGLDRKRLYRMLDRLGLNADERRR